MNRAGGLVTGFERTVGRLSSFALGAAGFGGVTAAVHSIVSAVVEAEKSQARLEGALRATGHSAGLTTKQINDFAEATSRRTLFDDDAIRSGAGVLATFRSVQGETFTEGIKLATDLSTIMGQDLQSSIVQIGKALNDPIAGLTALRKIGVNFTETQRDMIKGFVQGGDVARAQGVILAELRQEFGGSAEGANTGLTGALHAATQAWEDFRKAIGTAAASTGVLAFIHDWAEGLRFLADQFDPIKGRLLELKRLRADLVSGITPGASHQLLSIAAVQSGLPAPGSATTDIQAARVGIARAVASLDATMRVLERRLAGPEAGAGEALAAAQLARWEQATESIQQLAGNLKMPGATIPNVVTSGLTDFLADMDRRDQQQLEQLLAALSGGGFTPKDFRNVGGVPGGPAVQDVATIGGAGKAITLAATDFELASIITVGAFSQMAEAAIFGGNRVASAISGIISTIISSVRSNQLAQIASGTLAASTSGIGKLFQGAAGSILGPLAGLAVGGLIGGIGKLFGGAKKEPQPVVVDSYSDRALRQREETEKPPVTIVLGRETDLNNPATVEWLADTVQSLVDRRVIVLTGGA